MIEVGAVLRQNALLYHSCSVTESSIDVLDDSLTGLVAILCFIRDLVIPPNYVLCQINPAFHRTY